MTSLLNLARSPRNVCFACGPGNPCGLHLEFSKQGGMVRAAFTPRMDHAGWSGVVHGGILTTALDEAMAYVLYFRGVRAMTGRLDVRFRRPVAVGDRLTVEAETTREVRNVVDVSARLCRTDTVVAEAEARFMVLGPLVPEDLIQDAAGVGNV
ncbi:MAG TPA: PaaI family thioesterase [Chloroflexota bacterium]|nr:PaaI family thioesterase [Chloroflexota bacterium]